MSSRFYTPALLALFSTALLAAEETEWPYAKPVAVTPPAVTHSDRVRNGIDAFILQRLEMDQLSFAPEASKQTLLRRLYLDLIGLPPSPEEMAVFLNDNATNAYERVVEKLLHDARYGERWARWWLDLARYADTAGYEGDPDLPHAWRYRDYVIDAFNNDKPYDLFIKEQIAGDEFDEVMGAGELPNPSPEQMVALTFLRLAPFTEPRGDETRHEMLSEMTSTVGSVFLGLTVGCAKCHDHKYDRIPTKDFYRLKAFFSTVQIAPPERGDTYQIGGSLPASFYRKGEADWAAQRRIQLERLPKEFDDLKTRLESKLGTVIYPNAKGRPDLDRLVAESKLVTEEERVQYRELSTQTRFVKQNLKRLEPMALSLRHSFGPPYEPGVPTSQVMVRGEYDHPGDVVEAGFLSCVTGNQEPAAIRLDPFKRWPTRSRRMALAQWIANADNPLTARVMVNRLWYWHFGQGIVSTPSDFGKLSGGPSHPELLDWLALKFIEAKWSIKAMHRLIVTSSTYRQSAQGASSRAEQIDPDNRLLWRFNRHRLEAEAVRDSILAVSGRLNPERFGLPIFPPLPGDIAETVKYSESKWNTQSGAQGRKRSIYIYQQRTLTMPLMQSFDSLVCEESRPQRRSSVTPLQALALYNGEFVNEEARYFAERVRKEAGEQPKLQVERAFKLALGRGPSEEESQRMIALMSASEHGLVSVCRVLYNANEFVYID